MIITLVVIGAICFDVLLLLYSGWIQKPMDFWILILGFLGGMIVTTLLIWLVIMIGAIFVNKKKDHVKPLKFHQFFIFAACQLVLELARCKIKIIGKEKLPPKNTPFVYVSNHQSNLDAVATAWYLRKYPMTFVLKDNLMKYPFVREYISGWGSLALNRKSIRAGLAMIDKACARIQKYKRSIAIFPEGTRSKSYVMGPFHRGSFKIPLKSGCPIVVAAIQNGCKVTSRFPCKRTVMYVKIVKVYSYDEYKDATTAFLADETHRLIEAALDSLPKY